MNLFGRKINLAGPGRKDFVRFWHEAGAGRELLLPAVEAAFLGNGCRVARDDGWRCYDLRIWAGPWLVHDLLTVTEYHENGAALTRVRVTSRVTGLALMAVLALAAVAALLGLLFLSLSLLVGMAWLVFSVALWGIIVCRARGWLRKLLESVGRSLGASVKGASRAL